MKSGIPGTIPYSNWNHRNSRKAQPSLAHLHRYSTATAQLLPHFPISTYSGVDLSLLPQDLATLTVHERSSTSLGSWYQLIKGDRFRDRFWYQLLCPLRSVAALFHLPLDRVQCSRGSSPLLGVRVPIGCSRNQASDLIREWLGIIRCTLVHVIRVHPETKMLVGRTYYQCTAIVLAPSIP